MVGTAEFYLCGWERFTEQRLRGFKRIVFGLRVSSLAYDAFFNAPHGYRGQYASSPGAGVKANEATIEAFSSPASSLASELGVGTAAQVDTSLRAPQAKVWIREAEVETQFTGDPAIAWRPWKAGLGSGKGLRAPEGRELGIKGGWINDRGEVGADKKKERRSEEIHESGFT